MLIYFNTVNMTPMPIKGSFEPDDVPEMSRYNIEQHKQGTYFPGVY